MSGVMASVDARTQLAGRNRLELLMFRLNGRQKFGINVFKVREVIQCPPLTVIPNSHPVVQGVVNIRGTTITVMDLSMAIGLPPLRVPVNEAYLIITEYNRNIQGFLVGGVERIINHNWADILPPPKGEASSAYLTAVTKVDDEIIEIIDVERVLAEILGMDTDLDESFTHKLDDNEEGKLVLIADDSVVARNQVKKIVEGVGCETVLANDGAEALELLMSWVKNDAEELQKLALIISDIEMPQMDGYTLTTRIREIPALAHFKIMLHTSLSGGFNQSMIEKVGADEFLSKFDPDALAKAVLKNLNQRHIPANN